MVPLTYYFPWVKGSREERKQWMREFAEANANHIVLSSELLGKGCGDTGFLLDFSRDMREFGLDFVDSHALWGTWSDPGMPLEEWRGALLLRHRLAFQFCLRFGVETMAFHTGNTFNSIFGEKLTLDDYYGFLGDTFAGSGKMRSYHRIGKSVDAAESQQHSVESHGVFQL